MRILFVVIAVVAGIALLSMRRSFAGRLLQNQRRTSFRVKREKELLEVLIACIGVALVISGLAVLVLGGS